MFTVMLVVAANGVMLSLSVPVFSMDELNELVDPMLDEMKGKTRNETILEFEATMEEMFGVDALDAKYDDTDIVEPTLISAEKD